MLILIIIIIIIIIIKPWTKRVLFLSISRTLHAAV